MVTLTLSSAVAGSVAARVAATTASPMAWTYFIVISYICAILPGRAPRSSRRRAVHLRHSIALSALQPALDETCGVSPSDAVIDLDQFGVRPVSVRPGFGFSVPRNIAAVVTAE